MARGKKLEKALPLEEMLELALVPEEEQPYEIPGNWCWVKFFAISTISTGKKDAKYGSIEGKYYFFTCASEPIRCDDYSFNCKAILLAGNGDISNISMYEGKFEAYQRTYVVQIKEPFMLEYMYYFFKYKWVEYNKDRMFGTAIPYIRLGNLQEFAIPVAPLPEQIRIVERIEKLFNQLEEAKAKIQSVRDGFEGRKAAILYRAFTGELTKQWREQNGIGMDSWKIHKWGEFLVSIEAGKNWSALGHPPQDDEFGVVKVSAVTWGEFNELESKTCTDERQWNSKTQILEGDFLFSRANTIQLVGNCVIVADISKRLMLSDKILRFYFKCIR